MIQDLRHAFRTIARMPMVSAVIVLSLAAGIGINTVVFSWVQSRVFRPLPGVPDGGSFLGIEARNDSGNYPGSSWLEYQDLRERLQSFEDVVASRMNPIYVGEPGTVERVYGLLVSDNYFDALDVTAAAGRLPGAAAMANGASEPLVVIGHGIWMSRFGGDPGVIGKTIRVNGVDAPIVAVTPEIFQGTVLGLNFEVYLPARMAPMIARGSRELEDRGIRGYTLLGKRRHGVSGETAQQETAAAMESLRSAYPSTNAGVSVEVVPFWNSPRGPQRMMVAALVLLQGIMLLVLLAVCGNTANLVLARASARQREMGVRLALGSGPGRLIRLLLTENMLLGVMGAALGCVFAWWGANALKVIPLTGLPIKMQTYVDGTGLAVAMLLGVVCGLLVGAAPASQLARMDPLVALRAGARGSSRNRLRSVLMGVQVALAITVLIAASVFLRSFLQTRSTDPGFEREGVLLAAYDLAGRNKNAAAARQFTDRLLAGLRATPTIESAAISASMPLDIHGLPARVFTLEGRTRLEEGYDQALTNIITPGYFDLMRIPLVAGVDFASLNDTVTPRQAIINEAFVARYAGGREVLGRALEVRGLPYLIAGVARNSLYNAFGEPPTPIIYLSYRDFTAQSGEIHVRARNGAETRLAGDIRAAVASLEADLPVFNVRTLTDHVETNLIFRKIPAQMFLVLGPLLLVLASVGIYGVVAYNMTLRTTEIGMRLALGATPARVTREFVWQTMRVVLIGAAAGLAIAGGIAWSVLGNRPWDLVAFAGIPPFLIAVAALASWVPTHRATKLNPWAALRAR
ncbi:MAG: ADOP family duplicated permease [Acidobacteriota bacterium]|nr:ADOP family duplicated permease [Acidobacteriota bacterium]